MKHEQVVPDYWVMLKTSATCLLLVFSGYVLMRMVQAVFWLPGYLEQNQKRLEEIAAKYSEQGRIQEENEVTEEKKEVEASEHPPDEVKKEK